MCQQQQQPGSQRGAGMLMVVIVAISLFLAGPLVGGGNPKDLVGKTVSKQAGIFGSILPKLPALPKIGSPFSKTKGKGGTAKVPRGLTFTNGAGCRPKGDWRRVDPRVRTVLVNAAKRYAVRVSCLRTGHSKYVRGTRRVSNHTMWRAVDIDRVNGRPVRAHNAAARQLALAFGRGQLGAQPSEVGSPWFTAGVFFTDRGHKNHLHIGFRGRRR